MPCEGAGHEWWLTDRPTVIAGRGVVLHLPLEFHWPQSGPRAAPARCQASSTKSVVKADWMPTSSARPDWIRSERRKGVPAAGRGRFGRGDRRGLLRNEAFGAALAPEYRVPLGRV